MATREDLAYAAGIIDGEGSIQIVQRHYPTGLTNWELFVSVKTTDNKICPWLFETFGGSLCTGAGRPLRGWRPQRIWQVSSAAAGNFLRLIAPWLRLKKHQAELAFEFRETYKEDHRGRKMSDQIRATRQRHFEEMKSLKEEHLLGDAS